MIKTIVLVANRVGVVDLCFGATCISRHGKGPLITIDGTMDQFQYKEVLENVLLPELEYAKQSFESNWQIMQDNLCKIPSAISRRKRSGIFRMAALLTRFKPY
jgi:hypothetical protein